MRRARAALDDGGEGEKEPMTLGHVRPRRGIQVDDGIARVASSERA
jgi:hypothetical protein